MEVHRGYGTNQFLPQIHAHIVPIRFASFQYRVMSDSSEWEVGIEGYLPIHKAVVEGNSALHKLSPV